MVVLYKKSGSGGQGGGAAPATSAYGSWTRTVAKSNSTTPFAAGTVVENVTPSGVSYNNTNGRFTVTTAGKYKIDVNLFLEGGNLMSFYIKQNASTIVHTARAYVHTSVDPVGRSMSIVLDMGAGDTVHVETTINTITAIGTSMNIQKIG